MIRDTPMQFIISGLVQLAIDTAIAIQMQVYPGKSSNTLPHLRDVDEIELQPVKDPNGLKRVHF